MVLPIEAPLNPIFSKPALYTSFTNVIAMIALHCSSAIYYFTHLIKTINIYIYIRGKPDVSTIFVKPDLGLGLKVTPV